MPYSNRYDAAFEAIRELFNDTDIEPLETRSDLEELVGEIETMLDSLPEEEL